MSERLSLYLLKCRLRVVPVRRNLSRRVILSLPYPTSYRADSHILSTQNRTRREKTTLSGMQIQNHLPISQRIDPLEETTFVNYNYMEWLPALGSTLVVNYCRFFATVIRSKNASTCRRTYLAHRRKGR
jgi:hypothetical protein